MEGCSRAREHSGKLKAWESNRSEGMEQGSSRSRAQSGCFSGDRKVLLWPAWGLVGSFTSSFPRKGQRKSGGLWLAVIFLQIPPVPSNLTALCRWAGPRGSGESRTPGSSFFLNLCCFSWNEMLTHPTCDTFTWTSLLNCRSHGLQDFKGLTFLLSKRHDLCAPNSWIKWLVCKSVLHVCPPVYLISLMCTLGRMKQTWWGNLSLCPMCWQ